MDYFEQAKSKYIRIEEKMRSLQSIRDEIETLKSQLNQIEEKMDAVEYFEFCEWRKNKGGNNE